MTNSKKTLCTETTLGEVESERFQRLDRKLVRDLSKDPRTAEKILVNVLPTQECSLKKATGVDCEVADQ